MGPTLQTGYELSQEEDQLSSCTIKEITWNEFEGIWKSSDQELNWNCLFVLPAWLRPVCKHLGSDGQPAILAVYDKSRLIGLAPLKLRGDAAFFLGHADVCDYQDIIAVPGLEQAVIERVFDYLRANGIRRLELKTLRPDAAVLQAARILSAKHRFDMMLHQDDVTFEMNLPADWDAFLSQLSGKQRHEVRRKIRRLTEFGSVEFTAVGGNGDLAEATETFIDLFGRNRRDKADFMTGRMPGYFRDLIHNMAGCRILQLYLLKINHIPAAAVLCFDYKGVRYLYNNGYDDAFHELSIGILSKVFSIQKGIEAGCWKYDFLKGAEIYKQRMGGTRLPLYCCEILLQG